jgi:glycosyltransferase involved in cell wall biosynthesis
MDLSGYGIAARRYLDALDIASKNHEIDLKIYICMVAPIEHDSLNKREQELINKYRFKNDEEIDSFISDNDYECIWHMPTPMALFSDMRFGPSPGCSHSLQRIIRSSHRNHHLVVWETTDISREWRDAIEWYNPSSIITACKMNEQMYSKYTNNVLLAPHPIYNIDNIQSTPVKLPFDLEDKFTIFSMSQWTYRKGFDKLIAAFTSELGDKDDCVLILKTFGSDEAQSKEQIAQIVKALRGRIFKKNKKNNVILLGDYAPESDIKWFYENSDIFALLPRGEGFSLTIFEAILNGLPVMVPGEGGHVDYISDENKFMVDGMWDSCIIPNEIYSIDSNWFEPNVLSARKNLRLAYEMWKEGKLPQEGEKLKKHLLKDERFDVEKIGNDILEFVLNDDTIPEPVECKKQKLYKSVSSKSAPAGKLDVLKDSFKGETAYILNCGPSLNDYSQEFLNDFLKDKLTLSVKQAYSRFPEITDFHFFNCSNLPMPDDVVLKQYYTYDEDNRPIVVASSNYDLGQRWEPFQKHDIFFKIPIRTEINNEFISTTKKFDDFLIDNNLTRPCGPGIMYETVIYTAIHLGVSEIVCIGWDLTNFKVDVNTYKHFYGTTEKLVNRGDILEWEIDQTRKTTKELYYWLKNLGIELKLASNKSTLYDGIPRIELK